MAVIRGTHETKPKHSSPLTPLWSPFSCMTMSLLVQPSILPTQRHLNKHSLPLGFPAHWRDDLGHHPDHWKNEHGPFVGQGWGALYSRSHASQEAQSSELQPFLCGTCIRHQETDASQHQNCGVGRGQRNAPGSPPLILTSHWKVVFIRAFEPKINYCNPFANCTMLKF